MKTFSKVLIMFLVMVLVLSGTSLAAHTIKPTLTPSIESGEVVEPGEQLVMKIKAATDTAISAGKYYWNDGDVKNIFDNPKLKGKEGLCNEIFYTLETFSSTPGTNVLTFVVVDEYNNIAKEEFEYIVKAQKDTTAPTIKPSKTGGTVSAGTRIVLEIEDDKELDTVTYKWNDGKTLYALKSGEGYKAYEFKLEEFPNVNDTFKLKVVAKDVSGNTTTKTYTYNVVYNDKTAPVIKMSKPDGSTLAGATKLVLTVTDMESKVTTLRYNWEGSAVKDMIPDVKEEANECEVTNITLGVIPGTYRFHVTAINSVGKKSQQTFTYIVLDEDADTQKPTVTVSPNGGTVDAGDTVKITAKDNEELDSITYNWDTESDEVEPATGTVDYVYTTVPEKAGKHILYVVVEDEAGNKVKAEKVFYVAAEEVKDNEDPTITVSPKSGSTVVGGKVVKVTLKDDVELKEVTYNWDDEKEVTKSLSGTSKTISVPALPNKEGTYRLYVTVEDKAGNSATGKYTYYVEEDDDEGEYPTVDADPDGGEVEFGDKITIWAEDEDGEIEYVEYYWDDEDDDTTKKYDDEFTVKVPSDEGKHYLYVRAMDDDDNLCDYERFTYYVEENYYPGNSDIIGDINNRVTKVRVEIRNADDKIRFEPDEEILYYVDYYNGTSKDVKNVKLVVELPTYLEADDASDNGSITTKKVTWNIGTLEADEYGRVSFTAHYTSSKVNEKIITVPAKIYSGSSLKDTSTVRNMIFCEGASGTGHHEAYCVGYPDGTFRAEGRITRAELASMIANIEGITSTHRGQFVDANNHWAANYMQAVVDKGYMIPKSYNRFGAQDYATRADLAYAIAAILDVEDLEPIFISATDSKNSDARCAIEQLLRLGIMDGYSDGTARPNNNITRAEAVTIFNNYLFRGELYTKGYNYAYNFQTNYNHGGSSYILRFTDLSTSHWAYGHIMEATNNHRYERVMDGNEEML